MRAVRTLMAIWLVASAAVLWGGPAASAAPAHALIEGSGSSWAANAVNQWIADVHSRGLQVTFSSQGSGQGRTDFANRTTDFGVSDIGFQGVDPTTHASDTSQGRAFAYLPIVAGGTSLPYHVVSNGRTLRNLRLSATTIAKIFTQKITNWNDPAIKADNNGRTDLPNLPIIPVQHSEASGSSYQFTAYMAATSPSIWRRGALEYFPPTSGSAIAQNGSDAMINFINSGAANGSIGYDEYSYALGAGLPVIKVRNAAGYYTLPTQYNVAVALTKAQIDHHPKSDRYLLQDLSQVYGFNDVRTYPISSYSYAIIPIAAGDKRLTTAKRQTLADYLNYSICQGQAEMGKVGYSPLPINLVEDSFLQISKLHAADPKVDISALTASECNNPTFVKGDPKANYLARIAPKPPACDKQGAGPCVGNGDTGQYNPGEKKPSSGSNGSGSGTGSGNGTSGGTGSGTGGGGSGGAGGGTGSGGTRIDPNTGQVIAAVSGGGGTTGSGTGTATDSGGQAAAQSTTLDDAQSHNTDLTLGVVAGGLLLAALIAPALVAGRVGRKGPS